MGDYYQDAYNMRLNRYGNDYQSRILGQRKKVFQNLLLKSPNRVDFFYDNNIIAGILEPYKQDESQSLFYLLVESEIEIPNGTILEITNTSWNSIHWMIYWNEDGPEAGYNKYIILKMTHYIEWENRDGLQCATWAYFYGQEDNMLKDELQSRSRSSALYTENLKLSFIVMPTNKNIMKDDYFKISVEDENNQIIEQGFVVTGFDIISTPGVEYISVDPQYLHDTSKAPTYKTGDNPDDYYWFTGGVEDE